MVCRLSRSDVGTDWHFWGGKSTKISIFGGKSICLLEGGRYRRLCRIYQNNEKSSKNSDKSNWIALNVPICLLFGAIWGAKKSFYEEFLRKTSDESNSQGVDCYEIFKGGHDEVTFRGGVKSRSPLPRAHVCYRYNWVWNVCASTLFPKRGSVSLNGAFFVYTVSMCVFFCFSIVSVSDVNRIGCL